MSPRTFQQFFNDQQMFLVKKKEAEVKARQDKERQYQSMFKPQTSTMLKAGRSANESMQDSTSGRGAMERSEQLYKEGKERMEKMKHMTEEEILRLERTYDKNLTFQPTINKRSSISTQSKELMSESRRIDELCKKLTNSSKRNNRRGSDKFNLSERAGSNVSSIESERPGSLNKQPDMSSKARSLKLLADKLEKELA